MAGIEYHYKLVRDRVPDKIIRNGEVPTTRILSPEEKEQYLPVKMVEEVGEMRGAQSSEKFVIECSDLLEAFEALLRIKGISLEEVRAAQLKKYQELGGFEGGTFLVTTHKA